MNRYRKCTVTVVVENSFRLHNVTAYSGRNAIRLYGTTCGVKNYADFSTFHELENYVLKLCKNNYLKPRVLAEDFNCIIYDVNVIDISRPFEIQRRLFTKEIG